MDPISRALQDFQTAFRRFRQNDELLVLSVDTQPEHLEMLAKSLRVEEWQPDNQSPILIFSMPFLKPDEALIQMRLVLMEHYRELQKGMKESGQVLPPLVAAPHPDNPLLAFTAALQVFRHEIRAFLKEPVLCWMPSQVGKPGEWHAFLYKMLGLLPPEKVPMLIAGPPHKDLSKALEALGDGVAFHPFRIDEDQSADYFAKLMGPPSAGHAPGTASGSAAPDVAPPPRPGPARPEDAQIRAAAEEAGLGPMLTPSEADLLRQHVVAAARAAGTGKREETLRHQMEACRICSQAGVILEQALMTMLLAGYQLQFGDEIQAEKDYREAERLAVEIYALAQLAQIRLALGYLLLKRGKLAQAIDAYEQSAVAAAIDNSALLYFEAQRMAGITYLKAGDKAGAGLCWQAAVNRGGNVSAAERSVSSFREIAGSLIDLLNRSGRTQDAQAVQQQVIDAENGGSAEKDGAS